MFNIPNFSLWCDFIERDFLKNEFLDLVKNNQVRGVTTNPTLVAQAFSKPAYQEQIATLKNESKEKIYEALLVKDIREAADALLPLYEENEGDGFVSVEIDPLLCDDAPQSIEYAENLLRIIGRSNIMIKVPATTASGEIIAHLLRKNIPINVTLVFSPTQIQNILKVYDKTPSTSHMVISIFVSRFESKINDALEKNNLATDTLGIYNALLGYTLIEPYANIRTLFASTTVKNPNLPSTYYVDKLLLPRSVNTTSPSCIQEFASSSDKTPVKLDKQEINSYIEQIRKIADLDAIYDELLSEGLESFKKSFTDLFTKL